MVAFKTPIYIEMCNTWLFDDEVEVLWLQSEREIDVDLYTGVQSAIFEAIIENSFGDDTHFLHLVDEDNNILATINPDPLTRFKRYEVAFTFPSSTTKIYIKSAEVDNSEASNMGWRSVHVILNVESPTTLKPQIALSNGDSSAGGGFSEPLEDSFWGYGFESGKSSDFGYHGSAGTTQTWWRKFLLTKANWETIDHWVFEIIGGVGNFSGAQLAKAHFALFKASTGDMIPGSEITYDSATETTTTLSGRPHLMPTRKTFTFLNNETFFDDGFNIEVRMKVTNGNLNSRALLYGAYLYPVLTPVTKIESHMKVGSPVKNGSSSFSALDDECRWRYRASDFGAGTRFYFDATGREAGGNAHYNLYDVADADTGQAQVNRTAGSHTEISGTWVDPSNIEGDLDGNLAFTSVANSGDPQSEIELDDFHFQDYIPIDAVINSVFIRPVCGIINSGLAAGTNAGGTCAYTKVGGVDYPGSPNCVTVPQSEVTVGPPDLIHVREKTHNITLAKAWTIADFADGTFVARIQTGLTWSGGNPGRTFVYDSVTVAVLLGIDVATLDFDVDATNVFRYRTGEITDVLIDDRRYITHIDNGNGSNTLIHSAAYIIALVEGDAAPGIELGGCPTHEGQVGVFNTLTSGATGSQQAQEVVQRNSYDAALEDGGLNAWLDALVHNLRQLNLGDDLNAWTDAFSGSIKQINVNDSLNNWADVFAHNIRQIIVSDNLEAMSDLIQHNFRLEEVLSDTLAGLMVEHLQHNLQQYSDNLNNWGDRFQSAVN